MTPIRTPVAVDMPAALRAKIENKCMEFAISRNSKKDTQHYVNERAAASWKTGRDEYAGKLAEFQVAWYLYTYHNQPKVIPDTNIYEVGRKSYSPDLSYPEGEIHVKHCDYAVISWTFTRNDPILKEPEKHLHEWVALCHDRQIMRLVQWVEVYHLLRDPQIERFASTKQCLYLSDLDDQDDGWTKVHLKN